MKWFPLFILSLGLAIIIIDTTLLNVSLSYLIKDLHTDIQSLQWVITAYSLTLAALTITGGRLGDLYGRKKMFILGAAIFAVGSLIASNSNQVSTMIMGESIIEGIGAALMMPATMSLLVSTYRGRERAIAMGVWGGIAAASSAVGPILGGYLTSNYSWRWGFRINIIVVAILIIGSIVVRECRDEEEKPKLDIVGVILSSFGLLGVVFGIIESSKYGWWIAKDIFKVGSFVIDAGKYSVVPYSILIGLILLSLFFAWERIVAKKGDTPLVSLSIFKNYQFSSALVVITMMAVGQAGLIFSFPVFFQAVKGLDAYHTGLAFLPMSLTALFLAPFSAIVLSKKITPKTLIQVGLLFAISGLYLIRNAIQVDATVANFVPGMIVYGAGIGLTMAQVSNMALSAVSVQEAGEASGINNTVRQIGSSFGSAIIGAALLTTLSVGLSSGIAESKVIPEQMKSALSTQVSQQTSSVEFGGGAKLSGQKSAISDEITLISHEATAKASRSATLYGIVFTALGFLAALFLPKDSDIEKNRSAATKVS